jgi:hypothetical protein
VKEMAVKEDIAIKSALHHFYLTTYDTVMTMFTDEILVEKLGPITTIGINRPQKRNCINMATANKLSRAVLEFEEDDSALVGVLHGIGGNFCAGYDLEELSGFDVNMGVVNEAGHGPMVSLCIANIYFVFGLNNNNLGDGCLQPCLFTCSPSMGLLLCYC